MIKKYLSNCKGKVDILLTTYPEKKSRNVGDNLISHSALKIAKSLDKNYAPSVYFRKKNLDEIQENIKSILAPGFSVANKTYPKFYNLYSDLSQIKNFFPIGCSFQYPGVYLNVFDNFEYSNETLHFLERITKKHGALHCRDELIIALLKKHDIPSVYSGDMALYDPEMIGVHGKRIKDIKSIVFTVQHSPIYNKQAIRILKSLKEEFGSAELYISLHSRKNNNDKLIIEAAEALGYKTLELSGEVENLEVYKNVDLHVGYRLHGHIHFLRNRKPSVLIVEDVRSYGFFLTTGTSVGCFPSLRELDSTINMQLDHNICSFLRSQIDNQFEAYEALNEFIDLNYKKVIRPFYKNFIRKRWLEKIKLN
ncbi:polysaccharide pyruvyl transferase family protein [Billgrantia bachuensis]|uniref:Polysaccharide pyruvyl transferase family protein n=1 Tax=Billgrantia bachuensis TaxID=2717286 RepID=A0ABX0PLL0_9GAMM|nr:polysaccharide pyruvyl transferase family protein [Halomonas bachuensis]NIC04160.1 polysaccharide pyruvyl transferase family protein [Halomonas bachuensis]